MSDTVESLIAYCRENGRVCPLPSLWNRLWEMLPDRTRVGVGWQPPPLILAAWHDTSAMLKMLRLAEHIQWTARHSALESVRNFLHGMREEDWVSCWRLKLMSRTPGSEAC
jgi:hypothetical protein